MTDPNTPDPNLPPDPAGGHGTPDPAHPVDQPGPYSQPPQGGGGYAPPPAQPGQPPQGAYPPPGGYAPPPGGYAPPPGQPGQPGQPPQGAYPPPGGYQQAPVTESDERTWAMLGHLIGIIGFFVPGLIVYLIYKDRSLFLKDQGAEAANWGITMTIVEVAAYVLVGISFGILFFLPALTFVLRLVFGIIAGLAANKHENYRYPFNLRLIK
jgi:uncharacterized protein